MDGMELVACAMLVEVFVSMMDKEVTWASIGTVAEAEVNVGVVVVFNAVGSV